MSSTPPLTPPQDLKRQLGVTDIRTLRDSMPDEVLSSLATSNLLADPLAGQLIGRTRPFWIPTDVCVSDAFLYVSAAGSRQVSSC